MECRVEFLQKDQFNDRYFRNNRSNGKKNLRCFPHCRANHVDKQFCGQPVSVRVIIKSPPNSDGIDFRAIRISGKFNAIQDLEAESTVEHSSTDIRMPDASDPEIYLGNVSCINSFERLDDSSVEGSCTAMINSPCYSWSYTWAGSRYRTKTLHVFSVSVYVPVNSDDLSQGFVRVALAHSPPFCVQSMRRLGAREEHEAEKAWSSTAVNDIAHSVSSDDESAVLSSLGKRRQVSAPTHDASSTPALPQRGSLIGLPGIDELARVLLHNSNGDLLVKFQESNTVEVINKDRLLSNLSSHVREKDMPI